MEKTQRLSFGALLRQHRQRLGLTQEELAERAELSVRQLAYLERDRHIARPGTVRRLADALALSEEERATVLAAAGGTTSEITTEASRVTNLPLQPTPFIGRERETTAVADLLRREEVRLLTLTGPGGAGKTRLAIQVGQNLREAFPDGVVFVPLAALTDPTLVASAIAAAVEVKESPGRPLVDVLRGYLRDQRLLLLLDNFEHLLPAASLVSELLAACQQLTVFVTSRAVLHLAAEHHYAVPPLSVPDLSHLPTLGTLIQYDAVALFVERARAAKASFALTEENAPAVAEICHRLDGLPLAIELVAARIRLFPPQALLGRLQSRLEVLTGGARDSPARQQSLRATLDWSYSLLSDEEQTLLRRLSVFVGGCTVEAAEAVCGEGEHRQGDVLTGLESLVDQSLLVVEEHHGEPRFRMLETIREYARKRLKAEAEALNRRHAQYFTQLAEQVEAETSLVRTDGPPSMAASRRVEEEESNLLAALTWSVQHQEIELGLRLAGALRQAAFSRGLGCELRSALQMLLPQSDAVHPLIRARALLAADRFACVGASYEERNRWQGDPFNRALAIHRQVGDHAALLDALLDVAGIYLYYCGRHDRAGPLYEEALDLARDLQAANALGACLRGLGAVAEGNNDLPRARLLWEQSLEAERSVSNTIGIAYSLHTLAFRALIDRDAARATELCSAAVRTYREAGLLHQLGDLQFLQGVASLLGGRHSELVAAFRKCISETGVRFAWLTANWLALIAASWATQGAATQAARLYAAATAFAPVSESAIRSFSDLLDECLARGRSQVDEAAWGAAWEEGRGLSLDQAIEYALSLPEVTAAHGTTSVARTTSS